MILRLITLFFLLASLTASAQIDTINPTNARLQLAVWRDTSASYAVYFTDSAGRRTSSADIWDRRVRRVQTGSQTYYAFNWQWYRRDTLMAQVRSTGAWPSLDPLTHQATYAGRGQRHYVFSDNVVRIADSARHTRQDSLFSVRLQPVAFAFPMDLELLPMLPIRRIGQQFAVAFYEPGSPSSAYYPVQVTGRERLALPGRAKIDCWLVRIDYQPGSYATFWISERSRQVIKMREYARGRYRYKVLLY